MAVRRDSCVTRPERGEAAGPAAVPHGDVGETPAAESGLHESQACRARVSGAAETAVAGLADRPAEVSPSASVSPPPSTGGRAKAGVGLLQLNRVAVTTAGDAVQGSAHRESTAEA